LVRISLFDKQYRSQMFGIWIKQLQQQVLMFV